MNGAVSLVAIAALAAVLAQGNHLSAQSLPKGHHVGFLWVLYNNLRQTVFSDEGGPMPLDAYPDWICKHSAPRRDKEPAITSTKKPRLWIVSEKVELECSYHEVKVSSSATCSYVVTADGRIVSEPNRDDATLFLEGKDGKHTRVSITCLWLPP